MYDVVTIHELSDPRLDDYRDLKKENRRLVAAGAFVAESETVVRLLLQSPLRVRSVLVTEARWPRLQDAIAARADPPPVYCVPQAVMDGVAGFPIHRGCLAVGLRPTGQALPEHARLVVALDDLVDVDNVGAIVRNARAFGADALLLSPRCADPYYRKAIRVAMGNTFMLPIVRATNWPGDLIRAAAALHAECFGAVLDPMAEPLSQVRPGPASVLVFGAEGPGISPAVRAACTRLVTIPMAGADSLNVATAAAVFLYHFALQTGARDRPPMR